MSNDQTTENRFIYPEFDGEEGYHTLEIVLARLLTMAQRRVWREIHHHYQEFDELYLTTEEIAEDLSIGEEYTEKLLRQLEQKGFLKRITEQKTINQQIHFVVRNDFSGLCHMAHEYYEWMQAGGEKAYPTNYSTVERIKADPQLYKKLLRFEAYRRFLETKKKGRRKVANNTMEAGNE